ncbi:hypothetical protein SUGI_0745290 [Cryptomeria japonica]|nr:hypothetical protein SUGI_0745290 [Cryptomeria japonica]
MKSAKYRHKCTIKNAAGRYVPDFPHFPEMACSAWAKSKGLEAISETQTSEWIETIIASECQVQDDIQSS